MTAAAIAETDETGSTQDPETLVRELGAAARRAEGALAQASTEAKDTALRAAAARLRANAGEIRAANERDLAALAEIDVSDSFRDRLKLTDQRIEAMAAGLETVAGLADPVGRVMDSWRRPNGLEISRVRVPLGVVGIIYESRPNVTADAGALALKAGNAAILRGGKESFHSARAIAACLQYGLAEAGLPAEAIQLVPTTSRAAVGAMLAMNDCIDIMVPRGGRSLIERVSREARMPVIAHLDGVCHVYVHGKANAKMARDIVVNAKMRRPGVCGAAECLLVDQAAKDQIPGLVEALSAQGCTIRGDSAFQAADRRVQPASDEDWGREYLAPTIAARVVNGLDAAVSHIAAYGSHHTDSIVTDDSRAAQRFLDRVDSAVVLHNASTQFSDGGEFGMGAEIGISTGKLHARGPVGADQLTSYKYLVRGQGNTRP